MILRIILAILVGISMKLVSPPIGLYQIHWFNLIPAFWAMRAGENKKNGWIMYLMGVSLIASNYYWVSESVIAFSNLPKIIALGIVLLYAVAYAVPFWFLGASVHWIRKHFGLAWVWLIPGLQVALEQIWPALFPYYHGALFYRAPTTWQFASLLGVTGVTYLIFLSNCACTEFFYRKREKRPLLPKNHILSWVAISIIFIFQLIYGIWRYDFVEKELEKSNVLRVAILQQNVTMTHRLSRSPWIAVRDWTKQTLRVTKDKPDLVIWPEGALGGPINPDDERPSAPLGGKSLREFFSELASRYNFALLIGGGTVNFHDEVDEDGFPTYTAYNSCYLFNQQGEITGRYDKMVPLPFGEYIPFADTFPILRKLIKGPGNFQAGSSVTYFEAENADFSYSFSTPICYEAILNSQMRLMSNTDLFINITNDAWFGNTAAPHQHAMLATVQSMEWGRPMFRLAYTGVSMAVEPHGKILHETKPFEEVTTVVPVRIGKIDTLYRKGGWIFPWLWVLFWSGLGIKAFREYMTSKITFVNKETKEQAKTASSEIETEDINTSKIEDT